MLMWPLVAGSMNAGALTASGAVQLINCEAVIIDVRKPVNSPLATSAA
jgi:hypothetical protein